jgi:hypothetical protein
MDFSVALDAQNMVPEERRIAGTHRALVRPTVASGGRSIRCLPHDRAFVVRNDPR